MNIITKVGAKKAIQECIKDKEEKKLSPLMNVIILAEAGVAVVARQQQQQQQQQVKTNALLIPKGQERKPQG